MLTSELRSRPGHSKVCHYNSDDGWLCSSVSATPESDLRKYLSTNYDKNNRPTMLTNGLPSSNGSDPLRVSVDLRVLSVAHMVSSCWSVNNSISWIRCTSTCTIYLPQVFTDSSIISFAHRKECLPPPFFWKIWFQIKKRHSKKTWQMCFVSF